MKQQPKIKIMTPRKRFSKDELIEMYKLEVSKSPHVYTDRRNTLAEMLRMLGVNLQTI